MVKIARSQIKRDSMVVQFLTYVDYSLPVLLSQKTEPKSLVFLVQHNRFGFLLTRKPCLIILKQHTHPI